jgi:hypothetical protein
MTDLATIDYRKCLLEEAERFCNANDLSLAAVGKLVMNDQTFFKDLKANEGRGCTVDTFQYVMRWFKERKHKTKPKRIINECRP